MRRERLDWLEGRGPRTLIGAVDDATGTVPFALFREQEDAHGYLLMLKEIIDRRGVPMALYSDRHSIFQRSQEVASRDEQLRGWRDPTQFARALEELGITLIMAHTPQAKGRVERAWDTFQDRSENQHRILPRYDRQFGVASAYRSRRASPLACGAKRSNSCPTATGPATLGPASKSKSGWTAAVVVHQGRTVATAPPRRARRARPVSCRPTRQPDQPVTVTAHPTAPRPPAKTPARTPNKPAPNHPCRRALLT